MAETGRKTTVQKTTVRKTWWALDVAVKAGLPVAFVTEDTTRSRPEALATLFKVAIDHGATRLCVCDTAGHATPDGVHNLIAFTRSIIASMGAQDTVKIDWHGHNDRGLAVANGYWKPVLHVEVAPGGEANHHQLEALLQGSGLEVIRK